MISMHSHRFPWISKDFHGFTELASLAKLYLMTLVVEYWFAFRIACFLMLFFFSISKEYAFITELASLAELYLITLIIGCLYYFRIFYQVSSRDKSIDKPEMPCNICFYSGVPNSSFCYTLVFKWILEAPRKERDLICYKEKQGRWS